MADKFYVIDVLAATQDTLIADDGTAPSWLVFNGSYSVRTDINLNGTYSGAEGDGTPTSASGLYYNPGNTGHRLTVSGQIDNARGSIGMDSIKGNSLANTLYGDFGRTGAGGADIIDGGNGNDTVFGGSGNDSISGDAGNDRIYGDSGNDTINANGGSDYVDGGMGADSLSGGADGTDLLSYAGSNAGVSVNITFGSTTTGAGGHAQGDRINGFNNVIGSDFNDRITDTVSGTIAFGYNKNTFRGGAGNDALILGGGDDSGFGGNGTDSLLGGLGNDSLSGEDGTDYLYGNAGNDVLSGGNGTDFLYGNQGADRLAGGAAADRFIFTTATDSTLSSTGRDSIVDFRHLEGDKIDLRSIDADTVHGLNQAFHWRGTAAFSGQEGDLRYISNGVYWLVLGDRDGNGVADFAINVVSPTALVALDFLL